MASPTEGHDAEEDCLPPPRLQRFLTEPATKSSRSFSDPAVKQLPMIELDRAWSDTLAVMEGTFGSFVLYKEVKPEEVSPDTKGYGTRDTYNAWRRRAVQNMKQDVAAKESIPDGCNGHVTADSNCISFLENPIVLTLLVIGTACACQAPFELMNSSDRGCGDLIALAEYMYGLIASAPQALNADKWHVPRRFHAGLAAAAVGYSALVNAALATQMPMPVAITMKNGNLVANMVIGVAVLRRCYSLAQIVAVLVVTAGLVVLALSMKEESNSGVVAFESEMLFGVMCLSGALLSRAIGGALQELAVHQCGASPVAELLFFRSVLGLPFFFSRWKSVLTHVHVWQASETSGVPWPGMWLLLLANLIFDYLCKCYMTRLVGATSALTATVVLTFQRFLSFIISMLVLNPQSNKGVGVWIGSGCVLLGTLMYSSVTGVSAEQSQKGKKSVKGD